MAKESFGQKGMEATMRGRDHQAIDWEMRKDDIMTSELHIVGVSVAGPNLWTLGINTGLLHGLSVGI